MIALSSIASELVPSSIAFQEDPCLLPSALQLNPSWVTLCFSGCHLTLMEGQVLSKVTPSLGLQRTSR